MLASNLQFFLQNLADWATELSAILQNSEIGQLLEKSYIDNQLISHQLSFRSDSFQYIRTD